MYDNKLCRLSLRQEEENTKMTILVANETMVYLKKHSEQESYFKQQELELREQELALQQERQEQQQQQQQQNLFKQQMMQQQQLMLAMFKKIVDKD